MATLQTVSGLNLKGYNTAIDNTLFDFVSDDVKRGRKSGKARSKDDSLLTNSSISTRDMQMIVDRLRSQQYRDSTKKNYYVVWRLFNKFIIWLDNKPTTWEDRLTLFIGYLIDSKKQSSTVKSYISAIWATLQEIGVKLNEDQTLITSLTKACRLVNDQIKTQLPIQKDLLGVIIHQVNNYYGNRNQEYLQILYRSLISTAYFRLFRMGELISGDHPVLAKDVHLGLNKRKVLFILRTSKMHWKNERPQSIKFSSKKLTAMKWKTMPKAKGEYETPCPWYLNSIWKLEAHSQIWVNRSSYLQTNHQWPRTICKTVLN